MSTVKDAEQGIQDLIDAWTGAVSKKDLDAILALYTPDVRAFDAIMVAQLNGLEAYGEHWKMCMNFCQGEMVMEFKEVKIAATPELGFAHFLLHCGEVKESGEVEAGIMRGTMCLVNTKDGWKIAHEHYSAPFDVETSKVIIGVG